VTLKGQGRDYNMLRAQYLENGWRLIIPMGASRDFLTYFRPTPEGQTPNQSSRKMAQTTWIQARMILLQ